MDISTILSRRAWTLTPDIGDLFTESMFIVLPCFIICVLLSCICTGLLSIILYIQSRVLITVSLPGPEGPTSSEWF